MFGEMNNFCTWIVGFYWSCWVRTELF